MNPRNTSIPETPEPAATSGAPKSPATASQIEAARAGHFTDTLTLAAQHEGLGAEILQQRVAQGTVVILANNRRPVTVAKAVGHGCRVKVNANLGTSPAQVNVEEELEKLELAKKAGADSVMDLSTGGDLDKIRRLLLAAADLPLGTVPIYQAVVEASRQGRTVEDLNPEELFAVIERHAEDGVDFVTVHCGVTLKALERMRRQGRVTDIVSRGGAFLARWMQARGEENPLYEQFDRLVALAKRYDLTLSLGDGLRPGSIADANDRAQMEELLTLGELAAEAQRAGVQVMIEGPGHVPLNEVEAAIRAEKSVCRGAPFYVLGPLVTDAAPGYDHITSAIGGAIAAYAGADFLCAVSPSEHLGLPTPADVYLGVMASRIAGHAADLARGDTRAWEQDRSISACRKALDWEGQAVFALDPEYVRRYREEHPITQGDDETCTMCGEFCALKVAAVGDRAQAADLCGLDRARAFR